MMSSSSTETAVGASSRGRPEPDRHQQLVEVLQAALHGYSGDIDLLEKAAGMLMLGDHLGWRVLVLVHSKSTLRRYEAILNIRVREFFPEEGPLSSHSEGYARARQLNKYWKVANGDITVEHRRALRPPGGRPA